MRYPARRATISLVFLLVCLASPVGGQEAWWDPPPVPQGFTEQERKDLNQLRQELLTNWEALLGRVRSHDAACKNVPAENPMVAVCTTRKASIEADLQAHRQAVTAYKGKLAEAQLRAAAKHGGDAVTSPTTEEAKRNAGECFDTQTCGPAPGHPLTLNLGHRPQVPTWMTKDKRWAPLEQQMQRLEAQEQKILTELSHLEGQLAGGKEKTDVLQVQIAEKKQELSKKESEIAMVRKDMIDLSIDLGKEGLPSQSAESPAASSSSGK